MARVLVANASELDIRAALPLIQTPTLVLHTTGDRLLPVAHSRYLHAHIGNSRLVEIPGADHHLTRVNLEPHHRGNAALRGSVTSRSLDPAYRHDRAAESVGGSPSRPRIWPVCRLRAGSNRDRSGTAR